MTTLQKRALLLVALLLLIGLSILLFGWQITLVLGVILSIGLSIPLSTLWQGLGRQSPSQQSQPEEEEWHSYQDGLQPEQPVYYFSSDPVSQTKEEKVPEDPMTIEYPQQVQ